MANQSLDVARFLEQSHKLRAEKEALDAQVVQLEKKLKEVKEKARAADVRIAEHDAQFTSHYSTSTTSNSTSLDSDITSRRRSCLGKRHRAPDRADTPRKATTRRSLGPEILNEHNSNIVKLDEGWTEIWCDICGANSPLFVGGFFNGVGGLVKHVSKTHTGLPKRSRETVLAECGKRLLDEQEVNDILSGRLEVKMRVGSKPEAAKMHTTTETTEHEGHAAEQQPTVPESENGGDSNNPEEPRSPSDTSIVKIKKEVFEGAPEHPQSNPLPAENSPTKNTRKRSRDEDDDDDAASEHQNKRRTRSSPPQGDAPETDSSKDRRVEEEHALYKCFGLELKGR